LNLRKFLETLIKLMLVSAGFSAVPAEAARRDAGAEATIVRRLSFVKDEDLEFGSIIAQASAGTIIVAPSGARTKTGGPILVGSAYQPARFAGYGTFNQQVQVSMGANTYTVPRITGGAPTMTLDTFVIGSTPTAVLTTTPTVFRIAAANGVFNFPLGATLRVRANQPAGTYRTTFRVTLVYQ
jgi:Domain of unknown function (DUF4402)